MKLKVQKILRLTAALDSRAVDAIQLIGNADYDSGEDHFQPLLNNVPYILWFIKVDLKNLVIWKKILYLDEFSTSGIFSHQSQSHTMSRTSVS